jgi:hypothetical protein
MFNPNSESKSSSSEDNLEERGGYRSSGREPYVFRANRPGDLPGVHADLMEKTLRRDEGLLYLLRGVFP